MDTQHGHAGLAMQQAVTEAMTCHRICEETITHCLHTGGRHADGDHIRLLLDCADICRTAADFMTRGSRFASAISTLCADICEACAADCATFHDDSTMDACVEACRRCAQTCRQMARAATT
jgi:hypothetical protein